MEFDQLFGEILMDLPLPPGVGASQEALAEAESVLERSLPTQLRTFYSTVGGWDDMLEGFHRFRAVDELEIDDDYLIFLDGEDDEQVCWGVQVTQLEETNPQVFNGAATKRDQFEWRAEPLRLSEFLAVTFLNQAFGGGLEFVGFGEWKGGRLKPPREWLRRGVNGPLSVFSRKDAVLGLISDPRQRVTTVFCAANSAQLLETAMQELQIPWEMLPEDAEWED